MAPFAAVLAAGDALPVQPIHCDVTDYNTVGPAGPAPVPDGLIDFGDVVRTWRIGDPASAAAAADRPRSATQALRIALDVLAGFHAELPLTEAEAEAFWPLVLSRAAVCALAGSHQARLSPENAAHREDDRRRLGDRARRRGGPSGRRDRRLPRGLRLRAVAGRRGARGAACAPPAPSRSWRPAARSWPHDGSVTALDTPLAPGAADAAGRPAGAVAVGRWGEVRLADGPPGFTPPATLHLGADVHVPAGSAGARAARRRASRPPATAPSCSRSRPSRPTSGSPGSSRPSRAGARVAAGDEVGRVAAAARAARARPARRRARPARPRRRRASGPPGSALCPDPSPLLGHRRGRARARRSARSSPRPPRARGRLAAAPLLRRPAGVRPRPRPRPLRRRRPPVRRRHQQRRGHRPRAPRGRRGRPPPVPAAEHELALPLRRDVRVRGAARRAPARAARPRVPRQLGQRGRRPRAAPRARGHRPAGRGRARGRLPRLDDGDRRALRQRRRPARTGASCCRRTSTSPSCPTPTAAASATTARRTSPRCAASSPPRARAAARPPSSASRCSATRAASRSHAATSPPPTRPRARRARSASPTRCRSATGARATTSGPSTTRACCPTSSAWPRPPATATRSAP